MLFQEVIPNPLIIGSFTLVKMNVDFVIDVAIRGLVAAIKALLSSLFSALKQII